MSFCCSEKAAVAIAPARVRALPLPPHHAQATACRTASRPVRVSRTTRTGWRAPGASDRAHSGVRRVVCCSHRVRPKHAPPRRRASTPHHTQPVTARASTHCVHTGGATRVGAAPGQGTGAAATERPSARPPPPAVKARACWWPVPHTNASHRHPRPPSRYLGVHTLRDWGTRRWWQGGRGRGTVRALRRRPAAIAAPSARPAAAARCGRTRLHTLTSSSCRACRA